MTDDAKKPDRARVVELVLSLCGQGVSIGTAYTQVAEMLHMDRSFVADCYLKDHHLPRLRAKYPEVLAMVDRWLEATA